MWEFTVAFVAVVVCLWIITRRKHMSILKNMGIPGPQPNFWFGNLWEMTYGSPVECMGKWIKTYGDVVGYYYGTYPTVVIADPDILKKIQISDFQKFTNRPVIFKPKDSKPGDGFTSQLTNLRDKRWKEIRSLLTPSFTTSKMRSMASMIDNTTDTLIENIDEKARKGESFDIYPMYQGLTMDVIGRTAFGIQTDCQRNPDDPLLKFSRLILTGGTKSILSMIRLSFPMFSVLLKKIGFLFMKIKFKGINPFEELITSVRRVIEVRRGSKNPRHDLLQAMMDAQMDESDISRVTAQDLTAEYDNLDEQSEKVKDSSKSSSSFSRCLTDDETLDNAVMLFLAGYETTSTALAFTTHFLIHYPEVQERARNEIKDVFEREGKMNYSFVQKLQYLNQVFLESLRIYPPIYAFVSREVGEDVTISDIRLKKGVTVQVPVYNIQHDERYWPDADKFDPDRFSPENKSQHHPLAFQAFGAGPRNCVGMRFAHMEAKLALAKVLLKYRLEKCDETDELEIPLRVSAVSIAPQNGIKLKVVPL